MKKTLIFMLFLAGCGYTSKNNEMIGQVKKAVNNTPLICPDYRSADISLGVLRNGVGSMSTQDIWITVVNKEDYDILQKANQEGSLVKINYDEKRFTFCIWDHIVTKVEIVK